ncbi:hypothetical protein Lser_V15G03777 [Lactuca serriola]
MGQLDNLVKLWLFNSISQNLITNAYSPLAYARKIWLNISSIFNDNKETTTIQLENELRCITMGDLSVHDYCNKIKKLTDLLEGLGEKVKERHVVIHALNRLSSKFESLANIIRLFPTFSEVRSILTAEETRLANPRVVAPSPAANPSSNSLIHVATTPSNRGGGGGGSSYRRNDRRGGGNNRRSRQQNPSAGGAPASGQYG